MKQCSAEHKVMVKKTTELRDIVCKCLAGHAPTNSLFTLASSTSLSNLSNNNNNNNSHIGENPQAQNVNQHQHHNQSFSKKYFAEVKNKYQYTMKCIENYIPYALALVQIREQQKLKNPHLKLPSSKNTMFTWSSGLAQDNEKTKGVMTTLTSSTQAKNRKVTSVSIHFDCVMLLYSTIYCMCNFVAHCNYLKNMSVSSVSLVNSSSSSGGGGQQQSSRASPSPPVERNEYDEEMRECSFYLRKACGMLQFIKQEYVSKVERMSEMSIEVAKMPELTVLGCDSVFYYCMGIGQLIAIQAAIISDAYTPTALARLCVQAVKLFDAARQNSEESAKSVKRFSENFRILMMQYSVLYRALTLRYLAIDENKRENSGKSVLLISTAVNQLEEMNIFQQVQIKTSGHLIHDFDLLLSYVKETQVETRRLQQRFERENRAVFRQPIPNVSTLGELVPDGVLIPQVIPFEFPKNKVLV